VAFIDSNGCYEYAEEVFRVCVNHAEGIPVMIGVDHSLSGGLAGYLSDIHDNLVYVVLDAHFDAIIPEIRCNLIQYDAETNPESRYSPSNPYIYGRPNSYNADSYLYYLWEDNIVNPENTVVAGVADHPPEHAWEIDDERVREYLDFYTGFEKQGVRIIQRDRFRSNPSGLLRKAMKGLEEQPVHLSIDLDVASGSCISGVRFGDYRGIGCKPFIDSVTWIFKNCNVVGLDICEFDPLSAKKSSSSIELAIDVLKVFNSINSK
jgi:arginase family enzyme